MAEKKIIDVEVRESGLDELNADLQKTEQNLKDVKDQSGNASKGVDDLAGNGGAIAILDQLTGGLATQMKNAYESTRLFNVSLKATRGALIATGIGALVVSLGLVVAYWDDIVDFISGANKSLERQIELQETLLGFHDDEIAILEAQKSLLEAEGKSTDAIIQKIKDKIQLRIDDAELLIGDLQLQLEKEKSVANEYSWYQKIGLWRIGQKTTEEEQKAIDDTNKKINDLILSTTKAKESLANMNKPTDDGSDPDFKRDQIDSADSYNPLTRLVEVVDLEEQITAAVLTEADVRNEVLDSRDRERAASKKLIEQKSLADSVAIAQEETKRKAEVLMQFGNFLRQIGEGNKALMVAGIVAEQIASVSQIITATGIANAKAVAASPVSFGQPWVGINTASAALSIAAGLASSVQAISRINSSATSPQGFTPTYGGSASGGGGATNQIRQPDFNIVGQSGVNQLSELIAENERKPVRAYVVSEDIRTEGELNRRIERSASIG